MAELTVEGIEPIARQAIRKRLRNPDAEHAILDVSPGGPPNTLLVHVNSGSKWKLAPADPTEASRG